MHPLTLTFPNIILATLNARYIHASLRVCEGTLSCAHGCKRQDQKMEQGYRPGSCQPV